MRMIGLGEKINGLYKLVVNTSASSSPFPPNNFSPTLCNVSASNKDTFTVIPSSAIRHFRFGHLSNQRLSQLNNLYPPITCDNKATCDICHFARHKASFKFELLHLDIWGPLAISFVHNHIYFFTIVDDFSRFVWIISLKTKS